MRDSTLVQVSSRGSAAIWPDGASNPDQKFVLRNCAFDGPPDWYFARRQRDAQFYLIDCTVSKTMPDQAPAAVMYPLGGGTPAETDDKRTLDDVRTQLPDERAYFVTGHREGGDYAWHLDNLASAPGAPGPAQIDAAWTFENSWNPERSDAPQVVDLRHQAQPDRLIVTFNEAVTVRGKPRLRFSNGEAVDLLSGSGTNTLEFSSTHAAFGGTVPQFELNGGAIFSTEAGARVRLAELKLPEY
jgi:pectinesterase